MNKSVAFVMDAPQSGMTACGLSMTEHVLRSAEAVCEQVILVPQGSFGRALAVVKDSEDAPKVAFLLPAIMPLISATTLRMLWAELEAGEASGIAIGEIVCCRLDALKRVASGASAECERCESIHMTLRRFFAAGLHVRRIQPTFADDAVRVTDQVTQAQAEKVLRARINLQHMQQGVRMINPEATYIDADVRIGAGTVVYPGNYLEGKTVVGANSVLLPNNHLRDVRLGNNVTIENTVGIEAEVGDCTNVGPFAYLRPNTKIGESCRIGDFVEIKNSSLGDGTHVSHLTYVGDSDLGKDINLGCGVVFVNYDGKKKTRSKVEDNAFIGCNVNLVSPVHIGEEAYIAAGSTVTEDVPAGAFCIARERQVIKEGWVAERKKNGKL